MSPNKRIVLNVIVTYGRSLYALILGLFSGRWVLMALGTSDYGLMGLIGGLVTFISVFNTILSSAVGRFYAVSVGASRKDGNYINGLEECRKWFNTAVFLHTLMPIILVVAGYPLGVWAIENVLSIPDGRYEACLWIWRFTCCSCIVSMISVPFNAMYVARQEIAELTIYGVVATTFNALVLYYMVGHPSDWLVKYSAWTAFVAVVPQILIAIRALIKYPECQFNLNYFFSKERVNALARYSFARFWSDFSNMISVQGQSILVNKNLGVVYNASMTVAASVSGHSTTLANALSGAFWPAIANKCGEEKHGDMMSMQELASRLGVVLVLVFALPLSIEVEEVLRLWLVNPPPFSSMLVIVILFRMACLRMTDGYWMAILGSGKGVLRYSWTVGWAEVGLVIVSAVGFVLGCGMWSIVAGYVFSAFGCVFVRLWYGRRFLGIGIRQWCLNVAWPTFIILLLAGGIGLITRSLMSASVWRIITVTIISEIIFLALVWRIMLKESERGRILIAIKNFKIRKVS